MINISFERWISVRVCFVECCYISVMNYFSLNFNIVDFFLKISFCQISVFLLYRAILKLLPLEKKTDRTRLKRKSKRVQRVWKASKPFRVRSFRENRSVYCANRLAFREKHVAFRVNYSAFRVNHLASVYRVCSERVV